jgi:hypothetical protein
LAVLLAVLSVTRLTVGMAVNNQVMEHAGGVQNYRMEAEQDQINIQRMLDAWHTEQLAIGQL